VTFFQFYEKMPGMENRYLNDIIEKDALALQKMAFVSGPRQVGKSTLAKHLLTSEENYFLFDRESFRREWARSPEKAIESRGPGPIILDEIHKDRFWKRKIKGLYDSFSPDLRLIVTGSARLDLYRKGSDSLLGRYIPYRLHPFSVAENAADPFEDLSSKKQPRFSWSDLMVCGGFPEPLLRGNKSHARRWSRLRLERIIAEDARDIKAISDLNALLILADLLAERIGSPLSINSLREDLGRSHVTVASWIDILDALYFSFRIPPFSKKISRSVKQEKKLYLYDILRISEDNFGARLENLTALHLLKACHFWTDTGQGEFDLFYVRTRDGKEVDFLVTRDKKPWLLLECKSSESEPSPELRYFTELLRPPFSVQLVGIPDFYKEFPQLGGIKAIGYERFFAQLV
jgi:uncharacterized protein